jgi:ankyrin repeat protein
VNRRDAAGMSPLCDAVSVGGIDVVRWLLSHGADVNGGSAGGATPLFLAIGRGGSDRDVLGELLRAGANVGARLPIGGRTPLHAACGHGSGEDAVLADVQQLLAAGADPAAADARGSRPIDVAVESGYPRVAQRLREAARGPATPAHAEAVVSYHFRGRVISKRP